LGEPKISMNQYAFTGRVYFHNMLSMTLTFEPMILKMSPVSCRPHSE